MWLVKFTRISFEFFGILLKWLKSHDFSLFFRIIFFFSIHLCCLGKFFIFSSLIFFKPSGNFEINFLKFYNLCAGKINLFLFMRRFFNVVGNIRQKNHYFFFGFWLIYFLWIKIKNFYERNERKFTKNNFFQTHIPPLNLDMTVDFFYLLYNT